MNRANDLTSLGKWRLLEADTDMILRAFLRAGAGRTDTMLMDLCRRMDRVKGEVIIPGKKETNDSATAQKFQSSVSATSHKRELNPFCHRNLLYCGLIPQLGASLDLFFFRRKSLRSLAKTIMRPVCYWCSAKTLNDPFTPLSIHETTFNT